MSKTRIHAAIVVISSAVTGYRRAGVVLDQGPNVFAENTFTEEQLQQLREDPRLTLAEGEEADPDSEAQGSVDADRLHELVVHIESLDKDDSDLWKEDGSPKATAYPRGTTADERDAAWAEYSKGKGSAE